MALQTMPRDVTEYPFVFFPVGLNLRGRKCVVIGTADDREAVEKEEALREVGARRNLDQGTGRTARKRRRGRLFRDLHAARGAARDPFAGACG